MGTAKERPENNLKRWLKTFPEDNRPQVSTGDRLLGAQMQYAGKHPGKKSLSRRLHQAEDACTRIEAVPLGMFDRAQLVESVVCPKILYDICVSPLSKRAMQKWRARTARAIWGKGSRFKCNEMVFSLLARGHAADPLQASALRIMKAARRMTMRYPHKCQDLMQCMNQRRCHPRAHITGPARQLLWALEVLGWTMDDDLHIVTRGQRHEFSLHMVNEECMEHIMREDLRNAVWQEAATRRPMEYGGAETGIDREITLALYNGSKGKDRYFLQQLFTGCVPCRERKFRTKKDDSPKCFFCTGHPPRNAGTHSARMSSMGAPPYYFQGKAGR